MKNTTSRPFTQYRSLVRTMAAAAALAVATVATAQSRQVPAPPQSQPIVIHGATIHTVNAQTIESGYVRFEDGKIVALGAGEPSDAITSGAELVDATSMHVYPGLISAYTQMGLSETASVSETNDYSEFGRIKPEVRAAVAVNPDSELIPVTRANGILTACMFPTGGLISGRCSTMRLDGWTWENMAINDTTGLVVSWPRTEIISAWWMNRSEDEQRKSIADNLKAIEDVFDDAHAYFAARDNDETQSTDQRYEGMRSALNGEEPIFVLANSAGQIESAVAWAARRGYEIIIVGGTHADSVIPILKKHDVPVIINGLHRLPSARHLRPEHVFEIPMKLHEAGIRFCIASGDEAAHERSLPYNASMAAAYGLDPAEALRSVTLSTAEILGVDDQLGSIEVGKAATIIVTTGDPLEILTDTLVAYIDGRRIDLGNRQKTLFAKYQEKYRQLGILND